MGQSDNSTLLSVISPLFLIGTIPGGKENTIKFPFPDMIDSALVCYASPQSDNLLPFISFSRLVFVSFDEKKFSLRDDKKFAVRSILGQAGSIFGKLVRREGLPFYVCATMQK